MSEEITRAVSNQPQHPIAVHPLGVEYEEMRQNVQPPGLGVGASSAPQQATEEHVYLIGRPPMGEFLGFVQVQASDGSKCDLGLLASEWRVANDHIHDLERTERGWADDPPIGDVSPDLVGMRRAVLDNPFFRRAYALLPVAIGTVELDRIAVFQKQINLEFVRKLQGLLGPRPTAEDIFKVCLPLNDPLPPVQLRRIAPGNAFVFMSPSNDLRFLDCAVLQPAQVDGYEGGGRAAGILALVAGFSANCFSALQVEGRLILNNGSHRAFALRERGITHAPCVIQRVSRREELPVVAAQEVSTDPDRFLKAPRPPLLKDYFDPKLRKLVQVPKRNRHVKITFIVANVDI